MNSLKNGRRRGKSYLAPLTTSMRTRKEIEDELEDAIWAKNESHPEGYKQSWKPIPAQIEILLDIRDLLAESSNQKK